MLYIIVSNMKSIQSDAPFNIRSVNERTQKQARTLILSGLAEHFDCLDESLDQDLNDIVANYLQKGHAFLVGIIGNRVVCTGALVHKSQSTGQVMRMSVAKEYRRQGLGTIMLQRLANLAKKRGYRKLIVETNHDWCGATSLYGKYGFTEYRKDEVSVYMHMNLSSNSNTPGPAKAD